MSELTKTAQKFRNRIEDEARFLETCEGGDPGTPDHPSIWVLGIEPGWSLADSVAAEREDAQRDAHLERYSVELQLTWPYNRKAFKLLAAIGGMATEDYVQFAERSRPFEQGSKGYFKANLFPEPFNNVGDWDEAATNATGFADKNEYRAWLGRARFAVLRAWIGRCRPKVIIGAGLTHVHDFLAIAGAAPEDVSSHHFDVNGHAKRVHIATEGAAPVAVVPHFTGGPHGLNSDKSIELVAKIIRDALKR